MITWDGSAYRMRAWCTPLDEGHQVGLAFKPLDAERTKFLGMKRRDAPVDEKFG